MISVTVVKVGLSQCKGSIMRYSNTGKLFIILLFSFVTIAIAGCSPKKIDLKDILNHPTEEIDYFKLSRKYKKAGIILIGVSVH